MRRVRHHRTPASSGLLDEEGRFGAPHPVLVAAVGTNAPERGESLEAFFRRVGMDGGDELARVVGEQETFSRVTLEWPLSGLDRRRLIALSAAPMFGRQREFLGYRGFGVLGEEIDAVAMPEDNLSAELAADDRSALPAVFEPEPQAPESAARPVESSSEFAAHEWPRRSVFPRCGWNWRRPHRVVRTRTLLADKRA